MPLRFEVIPLGEGGAEIAGRERNGVGDAGRDSRHAHKGQGGKGNQRAATGDGVDGPRGEGGQGDEGKLRKIEGYENDGLRNIVVAATISPEADPRILRIEVCRPIRGQFGGSE